MSASREKKQRQSTPDAALTQKQRKEQQEQQAAKRKTILYTVIGIIVAVLVVILLVWHSGVFEKKSPAAVINGQEFSSEDMNYYYQTAVNQAYSLYCQYAMFGMSMPFDLSQPLSEQIQDEESGKTWQQYFQDTALENLKQVTTLCDAANAEGYTLSADGQALIDQTLKSIDNSAAQNGMNRSTFLARAYAMSEKAFIRNLTNYSLASDYQDHYVSGLSYDDAALQEYYQENAASLDSYDFRSFYIDGSAANPTDEDGNPITDEEGNTVTATDEEKQAAMDAAKAKADEAVASIQAADDAEQALIDLAPDYVSESSKDSYTNDPDYSLSSGTIGGTLASYAYGEWLQDDSRKAGDVTAVASTSGYYVVLFLNRYLVEDATVNYSDLLVSAALDQADDESTADVDESKTPSQSSLDAAKTAADALLAQWQSGDATAESFAALTSGDATASQYTYVQEGQKSEALNAWLFDSSRKAGDTTILEESTGYRLVYFNGTEAPYWHSTAISALKNADLSAWLEELTSSYEATVGEGMSKVGS